MHTDDKENGRTWLVESTLGTIWTTKCYPQRKEEDCQRHSRNDTWTTLARVPANFLLTQTLPTACDNQGASLPGRTEALRHCSPFYLHPALPSTGDLKTQQAQSTGTRELFWKPILRSCTLEMLPCAYRHLILLRLPGQDQLHQKQTANLLKTQVATATHTGKHINMRSGGMTCSHVISKKPNMLLKIYKAKFVHRAEQTLKVLCEHAGERPRTALRLRLCLCSVVNVLTRALWACTILQRPLEKAGCISSMH